jgi:hypothetical protein
VREGAPTSPTAQPADATAQATEALNRLREVVEQLSVRGEPGTVYLIKTEWEKTAYTDAVKLAGTANSTGALATVAALHTFSTASAYTEIAPLLKSAAIAFGVGIAFFAALHVARVLHRFCKFSISEAGDEAALSKAFEIKGGQYGSPAALWATLFWIVQGVVGAGSGVCFFVGLGFAFKALLRL